MFIDFEGIDGSGKTTLSNRVAERLQGLGHRVCHAREGGALASPIAEKIRALTRDIHNLSLCERAELLLYAAREAQTIDEIIRPALGRGEWVIADRFVYSHLALARHGRGLEHPALSDVLALAADGVMPDLVIFVDVDPAMARARKRCSKVRDRRLGDGSRKGQAGAGLGTRLREGFRSLAAADPARWVTFDNTFTTLADAEARLVALVLERAGRPHPSAGRFETAARSPFGRMSRPTRVEEIRGAHLALVDQLLGREPALAAYLLGGLSGRDVDERRLRLLRLAPEIVAYGLARIPGEGAMALRHALKGLEPRYVARSLRGLSTQEADGLREELVEAAPEDVARSLSGLNGSLSSSLRARLSSVAPSEVLGSLVGLAGDDAWLLRETLATRATAEALLSSVAGMDCERAWEIRRRLVQPSPLAAIESLSGLPSFEAHRMRERFLRRAPRAVMRSLLGLSDSHAWSLREALGSSAREALDSVYGLADERAWGLRDALSGAWPAACARSLGPLAESARGRSLLEGLLRGNPADMDVLRRATWVLDPARAADHAERCLPQAS